MQSARTSFLDLMRCTPFLLLAYRVYYGLPEFGVRLSAWQVGLLSLVVYHTAHIAEILGSALSNLPREPIEAAQAFAFSGSSL